MSKNNNRIHFDQKRQKQVVFIGNDIDRFRSRGSYIYVPKERSLHLDKLSDHKARNKKPTYGKQDYFTR